MAVGDAENDHAFLHACGCAAAVANALPAIRDTADVRLQGDHGNGVIELMQMIVARDARMVPPSRRGILAGVDRCGQPVHLESDSLVLIAGPTGSGKSNFAKLLTERMSKGGLEFCVIDPEGDYIGLQDAVAIGSPTVQPVTEEALRLLLRADINVVVNVLALASPQRRALLTTLLGSVGRLRARSGRPHWLVVDEAHQLLSPGEQRIGGCAPEQLAGTILITVDPAALASEILDRIDVVLALGRSAPDIVASLAARLKTAPLDARPLLSEHEMLWWSRGAGPPLRVLRREEPRQPHSRHVGKYAIGDVDERHSFYFRGPGFSRARNLTEFVRIADDIDEEVWMHHLRSKDFSAWFRNVIRDEDLAQRAAAVELDQSVGFAESRERIRQAIHERYIVA